MAAAVAQARALSPRLLRPSLPVVRFSIPNAPSSLSSRCPRRRVVALRAASGDEGPPAESDGGGGPPTPEEEGDGKDEKEQEEPRGRPSLPALSEIRWRDLLAPEPANATAVVLTGALAWAGASLLLQLTLIFFSIFAAAVKYSFVAAILIFILIALL